MHILGPPTPSESESLGAGPTVCGMTNLLGASDARSELENHRAGTLSASLTTKPTVLHLPIRREEAKSGLEVERQRLCQIFGQPFTSSEAFSTHVFSCGF